MVAQSVPFSRLILIIILTSWIFSTSKISSNAWELWPVAYRKGTIFIFFNQQRILSASNVSIIYNENKQNLHLGISKGAHFFFPVSTLINFINITNSLSTFMDMNAFIFNLSSPSLFLILHLIQLHPKKKMSPKNLQSFHLIPLLNYFPYRLKSRLTLRFFFFLFGFKPKKMD